MGTGWTSIDECRARVREVESELRTVQSRAERDLAVARDELALAQAELRAARVENTRLRATCLTAQQSSRRLFAEVVRLQAAKREVHAVEESKS